MTINLTKHKSDLLFVPLGGSGEIGMNVNLYHLDGKWLLVDLGAGFADDWLPGVDMIVADISFIRARKKDLLGLVLTHAHEDHLGGVQYLWEELGCPVYATPFTSHFLKEKLADAGFQAGEVPITAVQPGSSFDVGPFKIELVQLTHSVPEMNAALIRTVHGNIFHTGDWKFDPNPMIGPASDFDRLKAIGDEGVLAMVSDSTNIFKEGVSGSEGDLRESIISLVAGCKHLVAVTTFASNVARIETIAKAAEACGRRVALAGRSLFRIVRAAQASGYLLDLPEFINTREIRNYPREKVLVICTGCQGEPMAATNKLATETHPDFRLLPNDTVIFSSKIIPGNEKRIFRLFNQFVKRQVEVLTEKDHFVHVSGHPNQDEVKKMYELVRPELSVPVHGELVHMHEHARLAKVWGVPQAIQTANGEIIKLGPGTPECIGYVDSSGAFAIDGNCLLPIDGGVMKMRRRIQREGMVSVVLILNNKGMLRVDPIITAPGALDIKEDRDIFDMLEEDIREVVEDSASKAKHIRQENVDQLVRSVIRRVFKKEIGKNPPIEVHIETIA